MKGGEEGEKRSLLNNGLMRSRVIIQEKGKPSEHSRPIKGGLKTNHSIKGGENGL